MLTGAWHSLPKLWGQRAGEPQLRGPFFWQPGAQKIREEVRQDWHSLGRDSISVRDHRTPWRRKWQPTPVFLPGKSHGQRSLVGYSPWGCSRVRYDLVINNIESQDPGFRPLPCHSPHVGTWALDPHATQASVISSVR